MDLAGAQLAAAKLEIKIPAMGKHKRVHEDTSQDSGSASEFKSKRRRAAVTDSDSLSSRNSPDDGGEPLAPLRRKARRLKSSTRRNRKAVSSQKPGRGRPRKSADNQPHSESRVEIFFKLSFT